MQSQKLVSFFRIYFIYGKNAVAKARVILFDFILLFVKNAVAKARVIYVYLSFKNPCANLRIYFIKEKSLVIKVLP